MLPNLWLGGAAYATLVAAGMAHGWSMRCFRRDERRGTQLGFAAAFLAGALYLGLQGWDWARMDFTLQTNAYGSLFFVISATLALMVLVGLALNISSQIRIPRSDPRDLGHLTLHLEVTTLYWSSTAVTAALVFATLYLTPHLL
jgi:heme/copper-type cytochrome/quinol oxidase subunit 3